MKESTDEGLVRNIASTQPNISQIGPKDIALELVMAGYDPLKDKLQAIFDMQQVDIPMHVINKVLELADGLVSEITPWCPAGRVPESAAVSVN